MSARDGSQHVTLGESAVGIPLCQWERDSGGDLIANWRRGCALRSGTPLRTAVSLHAAGGDRVTRVVPPPAGPRRIERLVAAAAIAVLYFVVGLTLLVASVGREPL